MVIKHRTGSYPVKLRPLADALTGLGPGHFVVTDSNVHRLYGHLLPAGLPVLVIEPGEETKNLASFGRILEWLASSGARRDSALVALGGGVIGDLAGFAASAYMRGINLIQMPTTLLSQVDSSVGGKVGVDLPQGKNLVGAFCAPAEVVVAIETLQTLEDRQFNSGMAEVLKYGFIMDVVLLESLSIAPLHKESAILGSIVERCISLKASVVQDDEFETTGRRAILNFGHTVGHAIEQATEYKTYLHGEAISIGMVVEAALGERLGITKAGVADMVRSTLHFQGLPTTIATPIATERLMAAMRTDKKATSGGLAFSLLTDIGGCKLVQDVPEEDVSAVLSIL